MIKVEKGRLELAGTPFELYIEFAALTKALHDGNYLPDKLWKKAFDTAMLSDEEVKKEYQKNKESFEKNKKELKELMELFEMVSKIRGSDKSKNSQNDNNSFSELFKDILGDEI